jgi:hypothetical protein
MRIALGDITGNRDAAREDQWRFNVLIRSAGNARGTVSKDRRAMADLGKPASWGEPLTIEPPALSD